MPEITVIRADLADPSHADGIVACLDAYAQDPMGSGAPLASDVKAALVPGLRDTPAARVWLAQDDGEGEFIGVIVAFVGYSTFAAKPRWNVHDISVVPAARSRGVGRAMLSRVIEDATAAGAVAVSLEVRHDNDAARHLYASLGFGDGFAPMAFWERKL
ncbi:MAG: GNAT family N-acetyltransferase [Solirubrobacteraceae bacterium]|nr:GNAT family N-acetyltransferase [Solirubrobacteraceae bacterium]